jgi:hypothetical protein
VIQHIFAGDPPAGAGAGEVVGVDGVFVDEPAYDRRQQPTVTRRRRGSGSRSWSQSGWRGWRGWGGGGLGRRSWLGCRGGSGGLGCRGCGGITDDGDHDADLDGVTLGNADLAQHPGDRRGHLGVDLVGRDFEQWLIGGDDIAHLLEPLCDGALGDGFAELGKGDVSHDL